MNRPPESSPFTPGQPVPIEFFVGRVAEVERLRGMVRASLGGRFKIGFVSGERGIGKSSVVSFVRHLVEREDRVAGAHVFLGGVTELPQLVRNIFDRILKESVERPWHGKLRELFGKHIKQVGLFGISVELAVSPEELDTVVRGFVPSLRRIVSEITSERGALLLVLDDINGLVESVEFANWLKSVVDEIATSNEKLPFCILFAGLEERRQRLLQLQPSLGRVFEIVEIRSWKEDETRQFFRQAFDSVRLTVDDQALTNMTQFAGGLPVLAHEIGDAVYRGSTGSTITNDDALAGVVEAAEVVGRKFLDPQVSKAIRSPRYRSILGEVAFVPFGDSFSRAKLVDALSASEKKVVDNFLKRMKKLGVIVPDSESGPGAYRFVNQLHQLYFQMERLRSRKPDVGPKKKKRGLYRL